MRFADPHACPSCGGVIAGQDRCPHCDLLLSSATSLHLWRTLIQADTLLDRAREESTRGTSSAPAPVAPPAPKQETAAQAPPPPLAPLMPVPPRRAKPPGRRWSTGSIILGLGALCLVVAALIFVTVSWSVLGATGRTAVLLVITLAVGAAATWVTSKQLRASAEALWAIFFGLFSIDYFAARGYGLFGFDAVEAEPTMVAFGLATGIGGTATALLTRRALPVVVPSLVAGIGVWLTSVWLPAAIDMPFFWRACLGLAVTAAATGFAWKVALRILMMMSGFAAALFYAAAVGGAIDELISAPSLPELVGAGHGIPMLVMIALTVAAGVAADALRLPAAMLATWGLASLIYAPAVTESVNLGFFAMSVIAAGVAGVVIRGSGGWVRGVRVGSLGLTSVLALISLTWVFNAVNAIAESAASGTEGGWGVRLDNSLSLATDEWLAFVVFGALALSVAATLRWPESRSIAGPLALLPLAVAGTGLVVGAIGYEPAVLFAALLALSVAIVLLVLSRDQHDLWVGVGLVAAIVPVFMTLASLQVTLVVWLAVAAVLIGVAGLATPPWGRIAAASGATALAIASSAVAADLASADRLAQRLVVIATALAAFALASFALRSFVGRPAVEGVAGLAVLVVLLTVTDLDLGGTVLILTIAGAALVALGILVADRPILRLLGSAVLVVGTLVRFGADGTAAVERFTGPAAALVAALVVLGLAVWHLLVSRFEDAAWLGNGLGLAVLPAGMTLVSQGVSAAVWASVALTFLGAAVLVTPAWARGAGAAGATAFAIGAAVLGADLAGLDDVWIAATAIVLALIALAAVAHPFRSFVGREPVEVTVAVALVATLATSTELGLGSQAFLWTVTGAVLVILGLFVPDRTFYRYLGIGALGVAWVMRLAASNVETVEAYTAPFAVVLLGAGLLAMRDNPRLRTAIALSPGLTLAFLPSLPQALEEPTGLRALLLGIAGLAALGVGIWRSWQMPFLFGTAVVTLLVLWNIGPVAVGLPRWTLIATAGIVLVGSGITWENRVRNARSATEFVQNLT